MAGLVPAIDVFLTSGAAKTWMPGTRPGTTANFLPYIGSLDVIAIFDSNDARIQPMKKARPL